MTTYKCPKCNGTGNLPRHANVLGGVCFSCGGAGVKMGAAPVAAPKFAISAVSKTTGQIVVGLCNITAKNLAAAQVKAVAQLVRGSGFLPETATVSPL